MSTRQLFTALFALALFALAVRETVDPDMWWHLRTGQYIWEQGIPHQDIFSYTVRDHVWITHEWLSEAFMWLVYRIGGFPGLMVAFATIIALTFWLVYLRCPGRPYLAAFVVLLAAVTSALFWGARPQMFNLLLAAGLLVVVEKGMEGEGRKTLVLAPLLIALWANLHSGYLFGVALLATYATGQAIEAGMRGLGDWKKRNVPPSPQPSPSEGEGETTPLALVGRRGRGEGEQLPKKLPIPQSPLRSLLGSPAGRLGLLTVASLLAALLNPNTYRLWLYPFETLGSPAMQEQILEWQSPDFHYRYFWFFGAMLALGLVSFTLSHRRPTWTEFLLFLGLAAAGLLSSRNIPLFAVATTPIITRHLLSSLEGSRLHGFLSGQSPTRPTPRPVAWLNWLLLVAAGPAVIMWTAQKISQNEAAVARQFPVAAVDFLEQEGLAQARGYNSYNWGGYLIWRGLPVFVDGRADVYGDDFLFYYLQTWELTSSWRQPLVDWQVEYVLIEPHRSLSTLLIASGEWTPVYTDEVAQVLVRERPLRNGQD
ncbi:MAG: hypothetical protein AB1791_06100 [Chloroflexota bacterium]